MNHDMCQTLREARQKQGLTQNQLADLLHVTRQTISNWETGRTEPDIDSLRALSELLDMGDVLARESAPAAPAEGANQSASGVKPRGGRGAVFLTVIALTALIVFIVFALRPSRAVNLTKEDYAAPAALVPGQAYLRIESRENPLYCAQVDAGIEPYWYYRLFITEENGVGFTIGTIRMVYYDKNGGNRIEELYNRDYPKRVSFMFIGGHFARTFGDTIAYDPDYEGVGFLIDGTDENGHALNFRYYLELR